MPFNGVHYRVRVISSDPYSISADNGADISITGPPNASFRVLRPINKHIYGGEPDYERDFSVGLEGDTLKFFGVPQIGSTYAWTFDNSAIASNTQSDTAIVIYMTTGRKTALLTATNANGCSNTTSYTYYIVGCSPQIPKNAIVVTTSASMPDTVFWLKAGATLQLQENDIVFAEPGSVVSGAGAGDIIYLKPGVSFQVSGLGRCVVLLPPNTPGVYANDGTDTFQCANLTFDYSQVNGSGVDDQSSPQISIHQTPDHLFATTANQPIDLRLLNLLGNEMLSRRGTGELDVDLSSLAAGMYIAIAESGGQRLTKKIAVVN
jgi:hypothetical protein